MITVGIALSLRTIGGIPRFPPLPELVRCMESRAVAMPVTATYVKCSFPYNLRRAMFRQGPKHDEPYLDFFLFADH